MAAAVPFVARVLKLYPPTELATVVTEVSGLLKFISSKSEADAEEAESIKLARQAENKERRKNGGVFIPRQIRRNQ